MRLASALIAFSLSFAALADDRRTALDELQKSREKTLAAIKDVSAAQWKFKPAPDRWSIAECAEHIVIVEDLVRSMLAGPLLKKKATPDELAKVKGKDERVLGVEKRDRKFKAPEGIQPTGRFATKEEGLAAFEKSRAATIEWVKTEKPDLREYVEKHMALGELDGQQWVLLIAAHGARHTAQMEEVKTAPGYPKE